MDHRLHEVTLDGQRYLLEVEHEPDGWYWTVWWVLDGVRAASAERGRYASPTVEEALLLALRALLWTRSTRGGDEWPAVLDPIALTFSLRWPASLHG